MSHFMIGKQTQGRTRPIGITVVAWLMKLGTSTIYQLLRRLESKSLVASRWEKTTQGPPRAYYEITPAGREVIYRFIREILSPNSPISTALGKLTAQLYQQMSKVSSISQSGKQP